MGELESDGQEPTRKVMSKDRGGFGAAPPLPLRRVSDFEPQCWPEVVTTAVGKLLFM